MNKNTDNNNINDIQIYDFSEEQKKCQLNKKKIIIISIIATSIIVVSVIVTVITVVIKKKSDSDEKNETNDTNESNNIPPDVLTVYNLSTFFYFDPVSENPCNEKNYWTPFDNKTTCYRWVSITYPDSNINSITIMLDHNIGTSSFTDYENTLKDKTSTWTRYKEIIDIIDEETIFKLMNYGSRPDKSNKAIPSVIVNPFSSQSLYIYSGKYYNQKGYWTKTPYDEETAYAIDYNGNNEVISISSEYGIRPVINIKKNLLTIGPGVIEITDIIKKGQKIYYESENELYDGLYKYEVLQGITTSNNKLFFMSSNNQNPEKGIMYSYELNNIETLHNKDYSNTGHGNGMTYNSKTNKVLVTGYTGVYEYNEDTLTREKEYNRPEYHGYSAIGYDYINDYYIGRANHRIFIAETQNMKILYEFGIYMFEAAQDLEYYNGYIFDCASDFGLPNPYQVYSFYSGYELIYVYDAKFDQNKNPTKNFGRIIAKFIVKGLGELESLSFRNGYVYFGFGKNGYNFYVVEYQKLVQETKVLS